MRQEQVSRFGANALILTGLCLLGYTLLKAMGGSLAQQIFNGARGPWKYDLYALCLVLPVPFHIMAIGLLLKRKWLSPLWARIVWPAISLSGCWLGVAIAVRYLIV